MHKTEKEHSRNTYMEIKKKKKKKKRHKRDTKYTLGHKHAYPQFDA